MPSRRKTIKIGNKKVTRRMCINEKDVKKEKLEIKKLLKRGGEFIGEY